MARLTGTDPAAALLRSQYEERAGDIERQTIEDLQRYGVLRGGGDTAEVLGSLRGELAQGRMGLDVELDRRRQVAVDQAMRLRQQQIGQEQAAAERGLRGEMAVGQVGGAETLAAQQLAQQGGQFEAAQDLAREQLTGQVGLGGRPGYTQSLAAQELAQRGALTREQMAQQEAQFGQGQQLAREQLTGQVGLGGPGAATTESVAARQLGLGERGLEADIAARMAQMTGYIPTGMGAPMTTLARQAQEAAIGSQAERDRLAGRQVGLSEAELYGFEPGREGRSTMRQRGMVEDIAARAAQQQLAREEVYGGAVGGPQTMQQQALAEDIAARRERGGLAREELYGGAAGEPQTLQQQLVESQLEGAPMDRQMMLAAQAIAAQEAGMPSLAEAIIGQVQGYQDAERRRVIDEIQTRFADLDPTNFDAFFKMAEEYNIPGLPEAVREDFGKGVTPGSEGSATHRIMSGRLQRGG